MHRSGTSALAGALAASGLEFGDEEDLLPAAPDNPRGFYELRAFKRINDHILEVFEGTWRQAPLPVGRWWEREEFSDLRGQASALATSVGAGDGDFVVKDPRASLTLPLWRATVEIGGVALVVRDPVEVVASLGRRNGMDPARAAELWIRYVAAGIVAAPDAELVVLADLFREPRDTLSRVVDGLGGDTGSLDLAAGEAFLDRDLVTRRPSVPDVPALAAAGLIFEQVVQGGNMTDLVAGLERRTTAATLDPLEVRRRAAERAVRDEVNRHRDNVNRHKQVVDDLRSKQRRLEGQLLESRNELRELRGAHSALKEARDHDMRALQELQSRARELERGRDALRRRYTRLRSRRLVRLALGFASLARPLFRVVRAVRKRAAPTASGSIARNKGPAGAALPSEDRSSRQRASSVDEPQLPLLLSGRGRHAVTRGRLRSAVERARDVPVTVVVPVHDAPEHVERCLESVRRHTPRGVSVLVVDDASTLVETQHVLDHFGALDAVTVLRNEENLGFTRAVNLALEHVNTDVVLLNSDTEVGPHWLIAMQVAAYATPRTGSSTAVSDNAGAFSVPTPGTYNPVPAHLDTDAAARIAGTGPWLFPETPTANGFCAYLRRDMLDDVGLFDAEAFPRGYGEENDLCMRAIEAGWTHVVADGAFVRHVRSASFGDEKQALMASGRSVLDTRHPDYGERVRVFMRGQAVLGVRERIGDRWKRVGRGDGRPRVLFVVHAGGGGTPKTTTDLAEGIGADWDPFLLTCDTKTLVLSRVQDGALVEVDRHVLDEPLRFGERGNTTLLSLYTALLLELSVDVLHVRHLSKNSLDLLEAAEDLGLPTVISLHDFYLSCPTVHLIDEHGRFCGGVCTPGDGPCPIPMQWVARDARPLKHDGVHDWRAQVAPLLDQADAIVTTSPSIRAVFLRSYPELQEDDISIIEHGRDLEFTAVRVSTPEPKGPVRLLLPGNLSYHKGTDFVRAMVRADVEGRLEVHTLGSVDQLDLGEHHGRYSRDEFAARVAEIAPHFIGVLSVTAESYSHTLSEAFATGIPVLGTDIGAVGDRIRSHGGGLLVPVEDPEAALHAMLAAVDEGSWETLGMRDGSAVRTVADMAADYDRVYRGAIAGRRSLRAPGPNRLLSVAVVTPGRGTAAPPSSHVRLLRPLEHPALREDLDVRHVAVEDLDSVRADVVIVHRTALEHVDHDEVIENLERRGVPLVVDVDDLLFDPDRLPVASDRDWRPAVASVRAVMEAATMVTVSTQPLAAAAAAVASDVRVVPNAIDERLWMPTAGDVSPRAMGEGGPLRVLYMGSRTHGRDLDLLGAAVEVLRQRGTPVRVGVVGGEREPRGWYEQVSVPHTPYPRFVPWLRQVAADYDVGVAPLVDDVFNTAKSDLKWLEYTALGLPAVFSDVPSYTAVSHRRTGLVVEAGPTSWADALEELMDPALRNKLLGQARVEVLSSRTLARTAYRWLPLLQEAAGR